MSAIPLYLFTGPEIGEKNDEIERLKKQAQKSFGQVDFYSFYAGETPLFEILSLLQNGSLFASSRFIIVKNIEVIKKKEELELLSEWIKIATAQNLTDSILVLTSEQTAIEKKLDNLIPKENKRIFWEMFEDRKIQWVQSYFQKNGYRIDQEAVDTILDMIENNTETLRNECSRFFVCFDKDHLVTTQDVENILANNREESAFTLFDAMVERNSPTNRFENSLMILQKIKNSKDNSSVQLLAGLTYCFRRLKAWHNLFAQQTYPSDFDLKINGFSNKKAQNQYRNAQSIWDFKRTLNILALLSETDLKIRSASIPTQMENTMLQMMLYSIIMKNGTSVAKYESID